MLYVKVPKDINEYDEKIFASMSFRQLKWGALAITTSLGWYFLTVILIRLPQDVGIYGSVGIGFVLFACGWGDYEGLPIDEYIIITLRFYLMQQVVEYDDGTFSLEGKEIKDGKKKKRKERRADKRIDKKISEKEG